MIFEKKNLFCFYCLIFIELIPPSDDFLAVFFGGLQ